jgi:hypothetical protein
MAKVTENGGQMDELMEERGRKTEATMSQKSETAKVGRKNGTWQRKEYITFESQTLSLLDFRVMEAP